MPYVPWLLFWFFGIGAGQPGSELEAPMAIVILFGLLSSTFLNMVVVPTVYCRLGMRRT